MSIHDGHRQRMRERFLKTGLQQFDKHEVLELLLYYSIPRTNTNDLAHRLIDRFKTVGRVLQASPEELMTVEGVGENTALYLSLLNQTVRYVGVERSTEVDVLHDTQAYVNYLKDFFSGVTNEQVYLLCLDAKRMVLGHYLISEGSVTSANIPTRTVMSKALMSNAVYVVLAHNHPGGLAIPSPEDEEVTAYLKMMLQSVGVILLDHIVVSDKDYVSLMNREARMHKRY